MNCRILVFYLSLSLIAFPAIAQQNSASQASIEGRTSSTDGQPLRKATLTLHAYSGSASISATSDENGKFSITGIESGRYILLAEHTGFLQTAYEIHRIPGNGGEGDPVLNLAAGQHLTGIDIQMQPQAVIFGKVTDEDGDPMSGVRVTALLTAHGRGSARLVSSGNAVTDDNGGFRITQLEANRYYLSIVPAIQNARRTGDAAGGPEMVYARTYYPAGSDVEHASAVDVPEGRETRVDIQLHKVPAFHLRGRLDGELPARDSSAPFSGFLQIYATPLGVLEGNDMRSAQRVAPDGSFDVPGLTPGVWNVSARALTGSSQLVAHAMVTIRNRDLDDFRLGSKNSGNIRGTVTIVPQGAAGRVARISLEPAEMGLLTSSNGTTGPVAENGSFAIEKVPPLDFRVSADVPPGGYLKSATLNGHDALHAAMDMSEGGTLAVVISMTAAEISGKVTDADGQPLAASVVIIPDPLQPGNDDLYHRLRAKADGSFVAGGLAPGKYKVYAWEELEAGAQRDVDYMKPFESLGTAVSVDDNDKKTIALARISKEQAQNVVRATKK